MPVVVLLAVATVVVGAACFSLAIVGSVLLPFHESYSILIAFMCNIFLQFLTVFLRISWL